ncbi:MAG: tRNA lysidine(34) synthetase TilS [Sulfurospirillaceae bacterium]|nr:tRNA lysidine(34) synthetase TilS [Sulfurospirillaceae bacterium]
MRQLPNLHDAVIKSLKNGKNLLAFSGGVDSSALFFILRSYEVEFDLAIVDYNIREQSKEEVEYAGQLCSTYGKTMFLHNCKLDDSNFESNARVERYDFFEKIIKENNYTNLITAHHLNDKVEWLLMQFAKGSGLVEMLGFDKVQERDGYSIIRPLSNISKKELQNFLDINKIQYFIDKSNTSDKYTRNKIRSKYANDFVDEFEKGIVRSFEYLRNDVNLLTSENNINVKDLYICKREPEDLKNIRQIDKLLKKLGVLMSHTQRDEVLKTKDCVVSHKIVVAFSDDLIFISPFVQKSMPKIFKESCRIHKIPTKIRPYIYSEDIDVVTLVELIYKLLS